MNRADQAPEPSMEELLASIRLIISDADKPEPSPRELRALAGDGEPLHQLGEFSADEVFDLTDELVPTVEAVRPQPGSNQPVTRLQPSFQSQPIPQLSRRGALPSPEGTGPQARAMHEPPAHALRPEPRKPAQAPSAKPAGAHRETPIDAAHSPVAPGAAAQEHMTARHPARNWSGDIQMPVPAQGPVPLFPNVKGQGEATAAGAESSPGNRAPATAQQAAAAQDGGGEQTDVAALAERLARSAVGVLEATELENATHVDFDHLNPSSKAEVAEKFADAIESAAHAVQEEMSTAPGKVQVRQAAPQEQHVTPDRAAGPVARGQVQSGPKQEPSANADTPATSGTARQAAEPIKPEPGIKPQPREVPAEATQAAARPAAIEQAPAAPAPIAVQPLVQAQFVGSMQPHVPSQTGGALEDAVRDMLRPLLVQWLNENMPRILENAIREEITTRGLLPKSNS
jgi:cell pole-organizing protein PopZ